MVVSIVIGRVINIPEFADKLFHYIQKMVIAYDLPVEYRIIKFGNRSSEFLEKGGKEKYKGKKPEQLLCRLITKSSSKLV